MPLYIDLHIDASLTPELVKQCHVADKEIQAKYGVRYLQILLNQPQGHLFCLVEGPDKESCERVHREAHGSIACNMLEITESDFSALLEGKQKDQSDFTINTDGSIDTGVRTVLAIQLLGLPEKCREVKNEIRMLLRNHNGRCIEGTGKQFVAIFNSGNNAIEAATTFQKRFSESEFVEIRMGLYIGNPLESNGGLFEEARLVAHSYATFALNGHLLVSQEVIENYKGNIGTGHHSIHVIHPSDEKFLLQVCQCVEKVWNSDTVDVDGFARELGFSKSQLTRKFNALVGMSPNQFLNEVRLRKSVALLGDRGMNVAEVTMAVGFTNPSYFTKCFRDRFGLAPSSYHATHV